MLIYLMLGSFFYKMTRNYKHLVKGHEPMLYGTLNDCGSSLKFYNCKLERTPINYQTSLNQNCFYNAYNKSRDRSLLTFIDPVRNSVEYFSRFSVCGNRKNLITFHGWSEVDVTSVHVSERVPGIGPKINNNESINQGWPQYLFSGQKNCLKILLGHKYGSKKAWRAKFNHIKTH